MGRDGNMRILGAAAAAYVRGEKTKVEISGTPEQLDCLSECLCASKALYEALNAPDRNTESVIHAMQRRRKAARRFMKMTGKAWPL